MDKKILVAMSGGVDSSVAACLLRDIGWKAVGVTMRLFDNADIGDNGKTCCSLDDVQDARRVCDKLNIPFYSVNFRDDFDACVMRPFAESYLRGETPNPCIECNRKLKFERLFRKADDLALPYVATGHYARVVREGDRWLLKRALFAEKDQTYVLYSLTQAQLSRLILPLGEMKSKEETRILAEAHGFSNAQKPDSQDICFVPDGDYVAFLERYTGKKYPPGNFIDLTGHVIGKHKGMIRYTIGQRRGLGSGFGERAYVVRKNAADNTVTLGKNEDLYSRSLILRNVNVIAFDTLPESLRVSVSIRYHMTPQPATVYPLADNRAQVDFDEPQRAAAPGQAAVFYDGDTVVAGGTIDGTNDHR